MSRIILIAFIFVVACNSDDPANTGSVTAKEDTITELRYVAKTFPNLSGCYNLIVNGDTTTLKLTVAENKATGNLKYIRKEKDSNTGTISGAINDSLIVADYTFKSEGMTSVREVIFKIKGDSLVEGWGDLNTSGDTIRYKNKANMQFHNDFPLIKGACRD